MPRLLTFLTLFLVVAVATPLLALGLYQDANGPFVLVIAPPWIDVSDLVISIQGALVSPMSAPLATLADAGPDVAGFAEAAYAAGAWAVLDGTAMAAICGITT